MTGRWTLALALSLLAAKTAAGGSGAMLDEHQERRIDELVAKMTLAEKIGQMSQVDASHDDAAGLLGERLRAGCIGAVAQRHISFMGHIDGRHIDTLVRQTAPDVAKRLQRAGADAVLFTPG
mgnify:CR=1 FL=1